MLSKKLLIITHFAIFALITTSGGVAVLQAVSLYHITHAVAGSVALYRDGANLIVSCVIFSILAKYGYKKSLIIGLLLTGIACVIFPVFNQFWAMLFLFAIAGGCFALTKIALYVIANTVTSSSQEYTRFINLLEGCYMLASLSGFLIFSWLLHFVKSTAWLDAYILYAILAFATALWWGLTILDESTIREKNTALNKEYKGALHLLTKWGVILSLLVLCFYLYIENSFNFWLAAFNKETLHIVKAIGVGMVCFMMLAIAMGRLFGSWLLKYIKWPILLITSVSCAIATLLISIHFLRLIPITAHFDQWNKVPWAAYLLTGVGFFIGPIFPTLASIALQSTVKTRQGAMMTLIMIVAAIGGIFGAKMTGFLFDIRGGFFAIRSLLVPLFMFLVVIPLYSVWHKKTIKDFKE